MCIGGYSFSIFFYRSTFNTVLLRYRTTRNAHPCYLTLSNATSEREGIPVDHIPSCHALVWLRHVLSLITPYLASSFKLAIMDDILTMSFISLPNRRQLASR